MNFVALSNGVWLKQKRSRFEPNEYSISISAVGSVGSIREDDPVKSESFPLAAQTTGLTLLSLGTSKGETKIASDAETRAVYDENHAALKRLQRLLKELRLRECLEGEIISCGFRLVRCA